MGKLKMQEPDHGSSIVDQMIKYNMEWIEGILHHNGADPGSIRANQMVTVYLGMIEAEYRRKYCD